MREAALATAEPGEVHLDRPPAKHGYNRAWLGVFSSGGPKVAYTRTRFGGLPAIPIILGIVAFSAIGLLAARSLEDRLLEFLLLAATGLAGIYGVSNLGRLRSERRDGLSKGSISVEDALLSLTNIAESRDRELSGHSERVARNSVAIGRVLGLAEPELERLFWVGMLHDVGKIGIPESILLKPGPLTEAEQSIVRKHATYGAEIVSPFCAGNSLIVEGIRHHHERWDGRGYPDRLSGTLIPQFARIVAVADVFEALTSVRSYRGPLTVAQAAVYVETESGSHFDPEVVKGFVAVAQAGAILVHSQVPSCDPGNEAFTATEMIAKT